MQRTWRPSPSARSRSPTTRAVLPPIPASISSKTSVPAPAARAEAAQRQHHPRELAAGGGVAQRRRLDPGVGRDAQLDRLAPVRRRSRRGAAPARPRAWRPAIASRSSSAATRFSSGPAASARPALSCSPSSLARAARPRPAPPRPRRRGPPAPSSRSISARQRSAWASTDSTLPPCLRSSRSIASSRSSIAGEPPGVGLDPLERSRAARRRRRPARPRARRAARRSRRAPGSTPADALQQRFGLGQRRRRAAAVLLGAGQPAVGAGGRLAQPLGVAQPLALGATSSALLGGRAPPPRSRRARSGRGRGRARASRRARAARPARPRAAPHSRCASR